VSVSFKTLVRNLYMQLMMPKEQGRRNTELAWYRNSWVVGLVISALYLTL